MSKVENRQVALRRVPPGDKWHDADERSEVFDSLTEGLEYIFQKHRGKVANFFLASLEGVVYTVEYEDEPDPEPEPPKTYSLYGEEY